VNQKPFWHTILAFTPKRYDKHARPSIIASLSGFASSYVRHVSSAYQHIVLIKKTKEKKKRVFFDTDNLSTQCRFILLIFILMIFPTRCRFWTDFRTLMYENTIQTPRQKYIIYRFSFKKSIILVDNIGKSMQQRTHDMPFLSGRGGSFAQKSVHNVFNQWSFRVSH